MLLNFLFLLITFGYDDSLAADSILTPAVELKNNPVAIINEVNNWGFILFFSCFFIIVNVINSRNKFFLYMLGRLFRNKSGQNLFYEPLTNETFLKIFLIFQTILLLSIIFYCNAVRENFLSITDITQMALFLGKSSLALTIFFLYKFISYWIAGIIFFDKETVLQWNEDFVSLVNINGIFLFFPALVLFYVESVHTVFMFFILFYLILNLFFTFYKIYAIFFQGKQRLVYFILYLCTQEIVPLYLIYRGFIYFIVQNDTI